MDLLLPLKLKLDAMTMLHIYAFIKKKKLYGKKLIQFTIFSRKNYKNNLKNIYKKIK
jgi:hypothetical protein